MSSLPSSILAFTGFLVLLLGLLTGAPLGSAINRGRPEEAVRAWRVAHSSLVNGGVMLLAIAALLPSLALPALWQMAAAVVLAVSVYAFSFALLFGAWKGHRGLASSGSLPGNLVYAANLLGATLSIAAIGTLAVGAFRWMLGA